MSIIPESYNDVNLIYPKNGKSMTFSHNAL